MVGWALDRTLGNRLTNRGNGASRYAASAAVWFGSSLGPRTAIRPRRICGHPGEARDRAEHEPSGQPVRQCELREFHEDARARRNLREPIRPSGALARKHRGVHRAVLQRQRLHSALGYKSPEEFEREAAQGNWAHSRGATVEFVVHDGNNENERDAIELSGDEDSNAVLFPTPSPAKTFKEG